MLNRSRLTRKAPLKRTGPLKRVGSKRARELREYTKAKRDYLLLHPYCQLTIARRGFMEAEVIAFHGVVMRPHRPAIIVPKSTEIHHRNKGRGARLTDKRWFMAVSRFQHDYVEDNKAIARLHGYLLPENADADGVTPDGTRHLPTPELMAAKVLPSSDHPATSNPVLQTP